MRLSVASFLFAAVCACPAAAQSNTTAGLAGVGAGAALSSGSQNGTTSSPAAGGGGGNTPIEIQIMVFQGMKDIASEIASLTASYQTDCAKKVVTDTKQPAVMSARAAIEALSTKLESDSAELRGGRDAPQQDVGKMTQARKNVQNDEAGLAKAKRALNDALDDLSDDTKQACSILVEDPTSANQTALYQAVQGYYTQLQQLDDRLQPYFALQVPSILSLGYKQGGSTASGVVKILNTADKPRKIKDILVTGSAAFTVDMGDCVGKKLILNQPCNLIVTFPRQGISEPDPLKQYPASISITSGDPDSTETDTVQTVQLSATVTAQEKPAPKKGQEEKAQPKKPGEKEFVGEKEFANVPGIIASASGSGGSSGAGGGGSTTPLGLTYLGDIQTALAALKSNITYGASGFQPTPQSFQLLVESELKQRGIFSYTSTSALNLQEAVVKLRDQFGQILSWVNDINGWANVCKPPTGGATGQNTLMSNTACANPDILTSLSTGQQIINGYTTLITSANDGSGSPVIVSVLRGMILAGKMDKGIPSLQLNVAAAGGSTKTNNIFLVNLFYTFAPSYNAGVIATFELRDKNNVLVDSGARNSLVAYTKWKSKSFHPRVMRGSGTCDSFCSVK